MVLLLIMILLKRTLAIWKITMIRKRQLMIMKRMLIMMILMIMLIMMRIRKLVEVKPSVVETSLCAASQTWRLRWEWRKYLKIFGKSGRSGANFQRYLGNQVGVAQIFIDIWEYRWRCQKYSKYLGIQKLDFMR